MVSIFNLKRKKTKEKIENVIQTDIHEKPQVIEKFLTKKNPIPEYILIYFIDYTHLITSKNMLLFIY